jgi:regulator of protease activity HflC (stomatin/prohibitin superfamily)
LLLALFAIFVSDNLPLALIALLAAIFLSALGAMSAFMVRVPEGTAALLVQAGRHRGTLGPGTHLIMPWIAVSHIVTRRQIPFELTGCEAPTRDNVMARIDLLLTFVIGDPARFVYAIAAPDFDLVMQAAGRDGVRTIFRTVTWSEVLDLGVRHAESLRARIEEHVQHYGAELGHLNITYARPNPALLASEESRQLAVAQRAEAAEQSALAERRLLDDQALVHMRLLAGIERESERLRAQAEQAEMRQRTAEIEVDTFGARLRRIEELLAAFPKAAEWEWQSEQLGVVRALAGNTRAIVQFGQLSEVVRAVLTGEASTTNGAR